MAKVILDPHFRKRDVLFSPDQLERMRSLAEVVWAQDDPMPEAEIAAHAADTEAILSGGWRYGPVSRFPKLRAILDVGGGFPPRDALDYAECFRRSIRV